MSEENSLHFDDLTDACVKLLKNLPECECEPHLLAECANYFGIDAGRVYIAAAQLADNYDLSYKGLRLLLGECLREFLRIFQRDDARKNCELSIPSPLALIMALQIGNNDKIRFSTSSMLAQFVMRSLFLDERPLDISSCAKRQCGLNKMRQRLIIDPPHIKADYLFQFGILCDECVKCGEQMLENINVLSLIFPERTEIDSLKHHSYLKELIMTHTNKACKMMGLSLGTDDKRAALSLYARLIRILAAIVELNERSDRQPLKGNSIALIQSIQLMVFNDWEAVIAALELLANEMETAPADDGAKRIYSFYIPFLQPSIDRRFRDNGVNLLGNAAFIFNTKHISFDLFGVVADWAMGMNIAAGVQTQCSVVASKMRSCGCIEYLTGAFAFDRRMGSTLPMQCKIFQEKYGIRTIVLDSDFWCENAMFGSAGILERIDGICAQIKEK